jgi:hypothetical protein
MKIQISPKSITDDNRYDATGDSIREAVNRIKRDLAFTLPPQRVVVVITASFATFGAEGDREEPVIEVEWRAR